jgi:hypothetical protein
MTQAIISSTSSVRLRGSQKVTETASAVGIVMQAAYRQVFEITNQSVGTKF